MIANISSQYLAEITPVLHRRLLQYLAEITAVLDGDYCSTWAKYWRTYYEGRTIFMLFGVLADSNS